MNEISERDVYELWWNYLEQSDAFNVYIEFCEWIKDKGEIEDVHFLISGEEHLSSFFRNRKNRRIVVPDRFKLNRKQQTPFWFMLFVCFGKSEEPSFSKWWAYRESEIKRGFSPIQDYTEDIGKLMDYCSESFQGSFGRQPTPSELRDSLLEILRRWSNYGRLLLSVGCSSVKKVDDIVHEFRKIVVEQRKTVASKGMGFIHNIKLDPDSRLRYDELKRYLQVYVMKEKEGMTMWDIVKELAPSQAGDDIQRAFWRDLEKAKKIIVNAKTYNFPGKY